MNESTNVSSRREFIKTTGRVAAVSALAGMTVPFVHAEGNETLQVALIGCGGRDGGRLHASPRGLSQWFKRRRSKRRAHGRAAGAQIHWLRCLPTRDGLPE